jgi:23S rRNA (cytosine1962-C5)-methyltransferase
MLHAGDPVPIDEGWFRARLSDSIVRRRALIDGPDGALGALRLVNGENDGLPALVVDRYADVLVVKLYSAIWWPWLRCVVEQLVELTAAGGVVLRLARLLANDGTSPLADGDVIAGVVPAGPVRFSEAGLLFDADVRRGQKTGHFLDQRGNRIAVGALAEACDVLDVFTATGGFSVHAAAGGASSVHGVDLSAPTLAAAARNMALNSHLPRVAACRYTTEVGDAFEVMERLARQRRRFDLVVVDPPAFAQRRDRVESALRAYSRLTGLACALVRRGGVLVQASCSSRVTAEQFHGVIGRAALAAGHRLDELARTGHEPDHPVGFPEGAYLDAGFWTVDR